MVGFQNIQPSFEGLFKCQKPGVLGNSAGPAKIKRKNKAQPAAESNPWANLDNNVSKDANKINEDDLMTKGELTAKTEAKKFCGTGDVMQNAKPCANCSCGLKE